MKCDNELGDNMFRLLYLTNVVYYWWFWIHKSPLSI